jgi:hypothetical protein
MKEIIIIINQNNWFPTIENYNLLKCKLIFFTNDINLLKNQLE